MPINQTQIIQTAKEQAANIREEERKFQEKLLEEDNKKKMQKFHSLCVLANRELIKINPLFSDLRAEDWEWDGDFYIKTKVGVGWIYFTSPSPQLFYFPRGLGYGGTRFISWDHLSQLLDAAN